MKSTLRFVAMLLAFLAVSEEVQSVPIKIALLKKVAALGALSAGRGGRSSTTPSGSAGRGGNRGESSTPTPTPTPPVPTPAPADALGVSSPVVFVSPAEVLSVTPAVSDFAIFCPDEESLPGAIREAVLDRDIIRVAALLSCSDDPAVLAEGFRFSRSDMEEAFVKTEGREGDPDVVTMKAIATSSIDTGEYAKLARMMRLAVEPFGGSTPEDEAKLEADLADVLSDLDLMQAIIDADPATEFLPREGLRRLRSFNKRKLTCDGCSPADSTVCNSCWASKVCEKFFWCQ